jgi:hypothetical protein
LALPLTSRALFAIRSAIVTAREIYSSKILVAGFCLLTLGIGNWIVGATEGAKFQALVHRTAQTGLEQNYTLFRQLDQQKNEEVLRRITEDRERYNAARVKLDFFNVVLGGGQLFFFAGLLLTVFGLMRLLQQNRPANSHTTRLGENGVDRAMD